MKLFSFFVFCFVAGSTLAAPELSQRFETKDDFTVWLPPDWKAIPPDVLRAYGEVLAKAAPNVPRQTYEYGFQQAAAHNRFTYPYILIQVKNTGRIPEAQLKSVRRTAAAMNEGAQKFSSALSKVVSGVSLNETVYDADFHILWSKIAAQVVGVGPILGLVGVRLTENGVVQIMGYAKESEYAEYAPLFEAIIKQAEIAEYARYKPRMIDAIPFVNRINWTEVLGGAVGGGIVGAIGALIARQRKKKTELAATPPA